MTDKKGLHVLPSEIQSKWLASLGKPESTGIGAFRLTDIRPTEPRGYQGQRITVLVLDENGYPMQGIKVAFAFSTADPYILTPDFLWTPPPPQRAFIAFTEGSGQIDQIQGSGVKDGQPGGVTVFVFEPQYSSDWVAGAGMLADHTGLHLTFQRDRVGVTSLEERMSIGEQWFTIPMATAARTCGSKKSPASLLASSPCCCSAPPF